MNNNDKFNKMLFGLNLNKESDTDQNALILLDLLTQLLKKKQREAKLNTTTGTTGTTAYSKPRTSLKKTSRRITGSPSMGSSPVSPISGSPRGGPRDGPSGGPRDGPLGRSPYDDDNRNNPPPRPPLPPNMLVTKLRLPITKQLQDLMSTLASFATAGGGGNLRLFDSNTQKVMRGYDERNLPQMNLKLFNNALKYAYDNNRNDASYSAKVSMLHNIIDKIKNLAKYTNIDPNSDNILPRLLDEIYGNPQKYDKNVSEIVQLKEKTRQSGGNDIYYQKYLKYKQKYINLSKNKN